MRQRATEQFPDVFLPLRDEALLERGRRRREFAKSSGSRHVATISGADTAFEALDDEGTVIITPLPLIS